MNITLVNGIIVIATKKMLTPAASLNDLVFINAGQTFITLAMLLIKRDIVPKAQRVMIKVLYCRHDFVIDDTSSQWAGMPEPNQPIRIQ